MIRSLAFIGALTLLAQPAMAQALPDAEGVRANIASFVQPTHEARTEAALALVRAAGFEPTVETFQGGGRGESRQGRNVVFVVPGRGGGDGQEILLTAHYDAVVLEDGTLADGVVDNAASVAAVVRAGQLLRDMALGHSVRVILFDQEELGLIGAQRWIEANGLENVVAVVNSDVAAYGDTLMYGQNNGDQSDFVTQAVQMTCVALDLQCVGYPQYPPSDDRAFSAAGAPVVSVGFQDEIGAHQMWLAFNAPQGESGLAADFVPQVFRLIHSDGDTMDRVDPATVILASETYAAIVAQIAAGADNP